MIKFEIGYPVYGGTLNIATKEDLEKGLCEMAEKIGISKQAYYKIENGISNAKLEVWKKIQDILGLRNEEMWEIIKGE